MKAQVLITARELRKHPLESLHLKRKPSYLLNVPLELRFYIYTFLTPRHASFSRPTSHPLYVLLHVCHTLRDDAVYLFAHSSAWPSFTFFTPQSCNFFFSTAALTLPLITDLTLYLPASETESLDAITRKLYLAGSSLRSLTLHLVPWEGRFRARERIVTAYMLPRRVGLSEAGLRKMGEGFGPRWYSEEREDFVFADTHSALAVRLAEENKSTLAMCGVGLRQLRVYGQPKGKHGLDFELAILKLELQMKETARKEGKELVRGFGARAKKEEYWYYDVWIEGEMEQEEEVVRAPPIP